MNKFNIYIKIFRIYAITNVNIMLQPGNHGLDATDSMRKMNRTAKIC